MYLYILLFKFFFPVFCEGCLHQNNIFVFRVHLLPLLLFQLKSQYSVCDITVGCSDNVVSQRGIFTPGGECAAAADKLCRKQTVFESAY